MFSVIIPVYNDEAYLENAILSVLRQTLEQWECILIDDGSTDGSGAICEKYAALDKRIRVFHESNKGVSAARNIGLLNAAGEYICFLDSDDYIALDMLEILNEQLNKTNSPDMLVFGLYWSGKYPWIPLNDSMECMVNIDYINKKILPQMCNLELKKEYDILPFVCNKVYKREIIKKYCINFDESKRTWEDKEFLLTYINRCQNILFVKTPFYYYVDVRQERLSSTYQRQTLNNMLDSVSRYQGMFNDRLEFNTDYVNRYYFDVAFDLIFIMIKNEGERVVETICDALKSRLMIEWAKNIKAQTKIENQVLTCIKNQNFENIYFLCLKYHDEKVKKKYIRKIFQRIPGIGKWIK